MVLSMPLNSFGEFKGHLGCVKVLGLVHVCVDFSVILFYLGRTSRELEFCFRFADSPHVHDML